MSKEESKAKNTERVAERLVLAAESISAGDTLKAGREVTMALAFAGHIKNYEEQERLRAALREPMQALEGKGVTKEHWQGVATELKSQAARRGQTERAGILAALVTHADASALYVKETKMAGDQLKGAGVVAHVIEDISGLKTQVEERIAAFKDSMQRNAVAFAPGNMQTLATIPVARAAAVRAL